MKLTYKGKYYRLTQTHIKKVSKLSKLWKCSDAEVIRRLVDTHVVSNPH